MRLGVGAFRADGLPHRGPDRFVLCAGGDELPHLFGEIAEITYTGAEQRLTLRKSLGSEDNSGDYRGFTAEETAALADGTAVTLKGDGTGFLLVLWQRDGYAYSLAAETGMTAEALLTLAASAG